jgi:molecular chaperone GrpE
MTDNNGPETPPSADQATAANSNEPEADPLAQLTKEAAELKDRWLRALAETENLRRRAERDVADARAYGNAGFARDMLGVADNIRRALEAVGADSRASAEGGLKSLIEGVELTERELLKALQKNGVKQFDPQGQKFDPNLHQAMYEVPDASVPAGTVVQVIQSGFMIADRVLLRPALVAVAKGGAKPGPAAAASGGGGSEPASEGTPQSPDKAG